MSIEPEKEVQILANRMTNWQRTQWARAKYTGLKPPKPELVEPFTKLTKADKVELQ